MMTAHPADEWTRVLDDYERALDDYERVLEASAAGDDIGEVAIFTPPASIAPLPEALRPRATELAERTRDLEARATELAEQHRPRPTQPRLQRSRSSLASASFDRRA